MPLADAEFYPLIVHHRPDGRDPLYQQPPAGTDMGAARLCPIADVRPGDWVLGEYERPLDPRWLGSLHQSAACFPALPAARDGWVALDGQSPVWDDRFTTVLVIPRECVPGYADRSGGYRVGDRVERTFIYTPARDDGRDETGQARPVIQRGTVTAVEDGGFSVAWLGRWDNGRVEAASMRLADPAAVARERSVYGFAVGDTVTSSTDYPAIGVVLELYFNTWSGAPMARLCWPGSDGGIGRYGFKPTSRCSHHIPDDAYSVTSREQYPASHPAV